jgi:hypothetical protein
MRDRLLNQEIGNAATLDVVPEIAFTLPADFIAALAQGDPNFVAALLQSYPQLAEPIFAVLQRVRGNAFAQLVIAAASGGPIDSAIPHVDGPDTPEAVVKSAPQTPATETKSIGLPEGYDGGPIRIDEDHASDRQKIDGFDQIANSYTHELGAPSHVRLPKAVVDALGDMWAESKAKNQEQGGNLVRTYGGDYKVKRTMTRPTTTPRITPTPATTAASITTPR